MTLVDNAIYLDGQRYAEPSSLEQTFEEMRACGGMVWIGMYRPTRTELTAVADELSLHPLAVDDTIQAHQRPKLERYGDTLFVVLRPARYLDDQERVEFGEVHIFAGRDFVITVRHAESPDLGRVRQRLEKQPDLLRLGPEAVLYAVLDQVVDEYVPVVTGLENDIDEIEVEVFDGDPTVSRRIYELFREVIGFQRATQPLLGILSALRAGFEKYGTEEELQRNLRDVEDHVVRIVERAEQFRLLLQNMMSVNATLVAQRQNDEMQRLTRASLDQSEEVKRISSWAAILFAPTLVGTVYGMNFKHMPELDWTAGYPMAVTGMFAVSVVLYLVFKRRGWL